MHTEDLRKHCQSIDAIFGREVTLAKEVKGITDNYLKYKVKIEDEKQEVIKILEAFLTKHGGGTK